MESKTEMRVVVPHAGRAAYPQKRKLGIILEVPPGLDLTGVKGMGGLS